MVTQSPRGHGPAPEASEVLAGNYLYPRMDLSQCQKLKQTPRNHWRSACFAVFGMAILSAPAARAGDRDFTLVNKTGIELADGATLNIKFGRK